MAEDVAGTDSLLAVAVARRYYLGEESMVDIGHSFGISRFKVARLLTLARSSGLVHIEIREPPEVDDSEAAAIARRYRIRRCHVVRGVDGNGVSRAIGELTASVLERTVSADDVLGLTWARTVQHALRSLQRLPKVPVVQLTGSMILAGQSSSFDLVRRAADLSGGEARLFHAPLIMPTPHGADAVRQQEDVVRAMAAVDAVTVAVCGIGAW